MSSLLILDCETTGFDYKKDHLIEVAAVLCDLSDDGCHLKGWKGFQGLQDPCVPIPRAIQHLTGITDEMVQGQSLDLERLELMIDEADFVVAFNAAFDRGFLSQVTQKGKRWLCAQRRIDWRAWGFPQANLRYLALENQIQVRSPHRAKADVEQLMRLLNASPSDSLYRPQEGPTYLRQLLDNADRQFCLLRVFSKAFDRNDLLRERNFWWGKPSKCWWKICFDGPEMEEEKEWLQSVFFEGRLSAGVVSMGDYDVTEGIDDTDPDMKRKHGLE